jgi:hypothetical protein
MQQQVPSIKITNNGEIYYINKATNTISRKQPLNKELESTAIKEMETLQKQAESNCNDELSYQVKTGR